MHEETEKKDAIVLDVDGVILDNTDIFREIYELKLTGNNMWDYFHANCNGSRTKYIGDKLVFLSFLAMIMPEDVDIILSTARNEKCRAKTEERLAHEGFEYAQLLMRPDGDLRPSSEVKKEHLLKIKETYDIVVFIDDDITNCEMAKELGILALRKV